MDNNEEEDKEDTLEGDRPIKKMSEIEKKETPKTTKEKLTGLQINNLPKEITDEGIIKFLDENVKKGLDSVNFQLINTETKYNKSIIVFSGMNPDKIEDAREKIDFKLSKQKFLDRSLYCKALKNITPVKQKKPAEDENNKEEDGSDESEQNKDLEKEGEADEK